MTPSSSASSARVLETAAKQRLQHAVVDRCRSIFRTSIFKYQSPGREKRTARVIAASSPLPLRQA